MNSPSPPERSVDVAVIGAGAAGLMAAVAAAEASPDSQIVALEGAKRVGAKILVSGGGRCNVTHHEVSVSDFHGSTPGAIKKVLKRFRVAETLEFFSAYGVELKLEETGKLFPVADRARVVVDALLAACDAVGAEVLTGHRVTSLHAVEGGFRLGFRSDELAPLMARRVILTTGGRSLPKSGSDGWGLAAAVALGHELTPRILPALVPLRLAPEFPLLERAGVTTPARFEVLAASGKRLAQVEGSTLVTHVGLSGPAVLDVSRIFLHARADDPGVRLRVSWWPWEAPEDLDKALQDLSPSALPSLLSKHLPRKFVETLLELAGASSLEGGGVPRAVRRRVVQAFTALELPITTDLGFAKAEVTAGGIPLSQVHLKTLESRRHPGLFLAGEILDVDGRIGGFNFQWAWASGFVAGQAAGRATAT